MSRPPRILAFAGSTREASFNKKLLLIATQAARDAGGEVTALDLRDVPMPLYDRDREEREGFPQGARQFRDLVASHDGMLISTPEYNYGVSGVLKNAIDWASRRDGGQPVNAAYRGKVAGIMSASNGRYGGARALVDLRNVLTGVRVLVLPEQVSLALAGAAFDEGGHLTVPEIEAEVAGIGSRLVAVLSKLAE